ncbi:MAG: nucleotidyltransferase domain-containing protein [Sporichthyaceae bacterium]
MDLAHPAGDLWPGARGRALRELVALEKPVSVRALARHAGISAQAALDLVNELAQVGLVRSERAGAAVMVMLNREHLAAGPLIELVRLRGRLISALQDELTRWNDLAGAWLFGSAARGDGTRSSDIDVLLVRGGPTDSAEWIRRTGELRVSVRAWTGNEPALLEYTRSEYDELVQSRNPLIESLSTDAIALLPACRSLWGRAE